MFIIGKLFESLNGQLEQVVQKTDIRIFNVIIDNLLIQLSIQYKTTIYLKFFQEIIFSSETIRMIARLHYSLCLIAKRINKKFVFNVVCIKTHIIQISIN